MNRPDFPSGDPIKAAVKILAVALVPNPPLRLVLGQHAVKNIRSQMHSILVDVDSYETWSEDLMEDAKGMYITSLTLMTCASYIRLAYRFKRD